jgi:predicted pyridoxine 5'-phosphate oxidase superfamily flavin-nucleotide-binding protein
MDSLQNIAVNPSVGLLFSVPGVLEMVRVNGTATLTTDAAWLAPLAVAERLPCSGLLATVEAPFLHCGKAFMRSALRDPPRAPGARRDPEPGSHHCDHTGPVGAQDAEARVETGCRDHLY